MDYDSIKRKLLKTPGALFEDAGFPASSASLYLRAPWTSYEIVWKRPHEIIQNPQFVEQGALYVDIEQGELGNCWFIAAAASLAANDWKLLHRVVPQDQTFDKDYAGIFRFRFWQYGEWKEVVVDDRLPTRNGQLIYSASTTRNEFWPALLEKAYAKLYGCYEAIDGGRVHDALLDLTGGVTELVKLRGNITPSKLTQILNDCSRMETLMGGAIFGRGGSTRENLRPNGLYEMHAYSIIRMKTVKHLRQDKLLLLLRNPFGKGEWNRAWSDNSKEWFEISSEEREDQALKKRDEGEFWMSVDDFIDNFDELELCHLSLDAMTAVLERYPRSRRQWKKTEFSGRWIQNVSAGGPLRSFTSSMFWTNPQFRLKLQDDKVDKFSVVVSLLEITDRLKRQDSDVTIGFVILQLQPGKEPDGRLTAENYYEYMPKLVETSETFWPYRERALHFTLDTGSYVIVPCTFLPHKEADFYLRVYSETAPQIEPVEEPVGLTEAIMPEPVDVIELLFTKYQSPEGHVDAFGLQQIFSEAKKKEYSRADGYSLETCRCFVSLLDSHISGFLRLDKVKAAWKYVVSWTTVFKTAENYNAQSSTVNSYELKQLFQKIGFVLDSGTATCLTRRYGGRESKISEDDFIQAFCRVLALYQTFKKKSSDGKLTQTLSEWLSSALYL